MEPPRNRNVRIACVATARWWSPTPATLDSKREHRAVCWKETLMMHLNLHLNERAILVRAGTPVRALGPGHYTFWRHYDVTRWNTDELVFTAPAAVLAALPSEWYETVHLAAGQYGIVLRDERPVAFLRPGIHRMWKVEANITLRVYDEKESLPELTDELRKVIPAAELLE